MIMRTLTLRKHCFNGRPRGARGFTITETMLAVAVLAILVGLAAPGFREIILSQAVKTASFDLFSNLVVARSEAVTRNKIGRAHV